MLLTIKNHWRIRRHPRAMLNGFTLLELLILIAVIGVMAVIAMMAIGSSITSFRLNAAATKLITDVRYAQQQARTHNGWYGVRFQPNPINRYNVYFTDGTSDVDVLDPANPAAVLDVDVPALFGGTLISSVTIGSGNKVEFNPIGTPYDDKNGSPLAADGTLTLTLGGSSRTIKILKNTGRTDLATGS